MVSTLDLLKRLEQHQVEFVVVGGIAGVFHGSQLVTEDVDVCAPLTLLNLERIVRALRGLSPRFRMHPKQIPLPDDVEELLGFKNLNLVTDQGQLDILSEITGIGDYDRVAPQTISIDIGGVACRVLSLDALIKSKKAINLPKDRQAVIELEAIRNRLKANS